MRVLILGNGVAGMEAALTLRAREPDWSIGIVSEESDHFFSRTALMWVLSGQLSHRCIEPLERDVYERLRFERVRARAVGVDVAERVVRLAGDRAPLPYDRLLIACGSRPRPGPWPGAELPGVGSFVTLQDLEWLEAELFGGHGRSGGPPNPGAHLAATTPSSPYRPRPNRRAQRGDRPPAHPVVIGGGLIGIEAVEVFAAAGLEPRFFVREPWFWPIALDERESAFIGERLRAHGISLHVGENVVGLEGPGHLERIRTDRGEYPADLAVVAIGVVPNTEWLAGGDIARDELGGIVVDASLETSAPGVFAAGDCASVAWWNGARRPEQLWYTARDQGRLAARRMLGDAVRYERGTLYNSAKLMDVEYTTAGLVNMNVRGEQNWFHHERGAVESTSRITVADGRVVGFNFLGRRWDHEVLIRWIEERRSLPYVLERLHEASFDTELTPRLVLPEAARRAPLSGPAPSSMREPRPAP